ncbi:MAG: DUF1624 domain-containing protein [Oscillospiraceae bacterium]|jgi:uncharacterized membrane protein|nr:DUF1624 domain-containing protein [Oscillospiraceae bacterium]
MSDPGHGAPAPRIELIDAVRGLSILLMVAYHAGYDLVAAGLLPYGLVFNPLLSVLQPLFAGVFILLAGVSARFSRDNRRRGLQVLGCALLVSLAAGFVNVPIPFGILHCLGVCMVLCGSPAAWVDRIPRGWQPVLFSALFAAGYLWFPFYAEGAARFPYLYMFGVLYRGFRAYDYFPLIPWFFLYLLGVWLGAYVRERRFPAWFYTWRVPVLPAIGRRTLLIYLLHQPVIYVAVQWAAGLAGE